MERSPEHLCNGSKIRFDLFIVISLTHEAFRGNDIRGSYFYRKLVAVPKRPSPETDTDSTSDGSTKFHHEDQPAKKRKKRASKKHDDDISGRMQGSPENNTSKAQSTHLEDMESDPESSILCHKMRIPLCRLPCRPTITSRRSTELKQTGCWYSARAAQAHQVLVQAPAIAQYRNASVLVPYEIHTSVLRASGNMPHHAHYDREYEEPIQVM
jgi:hypothetical protein